MPPMMGHAVVEFTSSHQIYSDAMSYVETKIKTIDLI